MMLSLSGSGWAAEFALPNYPQRASVQIASRDGTHGFEVAVAADAATKQKGLMFITHLPAGQGMLFVWDAPTGIDMWMKNTLVPLDMIFIDASGHIIHIAQSTEPQSERVISSPSPAAAVLEISGGLSETLGIKAGDKVSWQ